jgi:putative transposase
MGAVCLARETRLELSGRELVLKSQLPDGSLEVLDIKADESMVLRKEEFEQRYMDGRLIIRQEKSRLASVRGSVGEVEVEISRLSPEEVREIERKRVYIEALKKEGVDNYNPAEFLRVIRQVAATMEDNAMPSPITVYRWKKRYDARKHVMDLHSLKSSGNRHSKIAPDLERIMRLHIDEFYLRPAGVKKIDIFNSVCRQVLRDNKKRADGQKIKLPAISTVCRFIKREYDPYDVLVARKGKQVADRMFAQSKEYERPMYPLERVEIDHTKLDIFLVDGGRRFTIGRPWLTVAIDVATRSVLGFYMGFIPPSTDTVMKCLKDSFLPKVHLHSLYPDVINDWESYGVMQELVVDNGMEFRSKALEDACLSMDINIRYAPAKRGNYKGVVERFFQTLNLQYLSLQKGYVLKDLMEMEEYDPAKDSVLTIGDFSEGLYKWIVDVYHQNVHRGIGMPPAKAWREGIKEAPAAIAARRKDLDILFGLVARRTVSRSGIQLNNLFYNDDCLSKIRRSLKNADEKVRIKYDPEDLSRIYVHDRKDDEYLIVPAINQEYTLGLRLWQHKMVQRYNRHENRPDDLEALLESKYEIMTLTDKALTRAGKFKSRTIAARLKNICAPDVFADPEDEAEEALPVSRKIKALPPGKPAETSPANTRKVAKSCKASHSLKHASEKALANATPPSPVKPPSPSREHRGPMKGWGVSFFNDSSKEVR